MCDRIAPLIGLVACVIRLAFLFKSVSDDTYYCCRWLPTHVYVTVSISLSLVDYCSSKRASFWNVVSWDFATVNVSLELTFPLCSQIKNGVISRKFIPRSITFCLKSIRKSYFQIALGRRVNSYRGTCYFKHTNSKPIFSWVIFFFFRYKLNVSLQKLKINMSDSRIVNLINFINNVPSPKSYTVLHLPELFHYDNVSSFF